MSAPSFPGSAKAASSAPLQDARIDLGIVFIHSKLDDFGLTPSHFRVYCHIARRAGSGAAWPAVASIARICQLHPQTVRRALHFLVKHQLITRETRAGKTPFYRLTPTAQWLPLTAMAANPSDSKTPVSDTEATATKQMQGHPCESNGAEGSPFEGNPPKANTHDRRAPATLPLSEAEAVEAAKLAGIPEDFARKEFNGRAAVGWVNGAGLAIKSWPHYLRKRWTDEQGQRAERATRPGGGRAASSRPSAPPRQFTPDDYK